MAELTPAPETRSQLAAIAAVRWRLMANALRTTRGALEAVSQIWMGFWLLVLGFGGAVGFGALGWYFLRRGQLAMLALPLWGLFAFWQIFPLAASAFTEQADTSFLARYPLSYPAYCLVRIAFGAFDIATLVGSLCALGLLVGLGIAAPWLLPVALLGLLLFVAFNILLAQAIFAWLERWLARRRTREVLALLLFLIIFSFNFIGLLARRLQGHHVGAGWLAALLPLEHWLPPGLPAHAFARAAAGHAGVAAAALLLLAIWTAAVLLFLDLRLRAEFRGETLNEAAAPRPARRRAAATPASGGIALPGFSGPAAAVALKELRYLFRSPMMFFSLAMPVLLLVLFRMEAFNPAHARPGRPPLLGAAGLGFPIGVAYALLVLTNLIFNAFGTDDCGVQFYFVSPVSFRRILMGKNLACALILALEAVVIYIAAIFIDGVPPAPILAATLLGLVFAAFCDFGFGNLLSFFMPKKIDLSRLGRQNARGVTGLIALAAQAVVAGLIAIAVLVGLVLHRFWLTLLLLALLAAIAAALYGLVLQQADLLARSRRDALLAELAKA